MMTLTLDSNYAYAGDVKEALLNNKQIFVNKNEDSVVIFEKSIDGGNSIADCLIAAEAQGLIGVEIKTARDSRRRLPRQLVSYLKVCDYVYVLIHDEMLTELLPILSTTPDVGIICYTELEDKLVLGKVREAKYNNQRDMRVTLDMLWSTELWSMIRQVNKLRRMPLPLRKHYTTKRKMISYMLSEAPSLTHAVFIENIINGVHSPDKVVAHYRFRE